MDKRIHAYRDDIADAGLRGKVRSRKFVDGQKYQVRDAFVNLHSGPGGNLPIVTQALRGQTLTVFENGTDWCWGQLDHDSYVGYMRSTALTGHVVETTHRVSVIRTFVYPEASIKVPPVTSLSMNSTVTGGRLVAGEGTTQDFLELGDGSYIIGRHAAEKDSFAEDFVAAAQLFMCAPYLWGGVQSDGIDCSALVQVSMAAAGLYAPRDSDMQLAQLGEDVPMDEMEDLQRGDLLFWQGHVGIMTNDFAMLHANAYHMQVVDECLGKASARFAFAEADMLAVKRLPALSALSE